MHRQIEHGASTSISYITHAFVHGGRLGVIPSKRALSERFGSSGVEEVDVLGTSREVVVHATVVEVVILSFIGDHRSGSGTCFEEELDESE